MQLIGHFWTTTKTMLPIISVDFWAFWANPSDVSGEGLVVEDLEQEESDTEVETVESNLESEPESPPEIPDSLPEILSGDERPKTAEKVLCCSIDSCKTVEESIPKTTTDCNSESNQPFWAN